MEPQTAKCARLENCPGAEKHSTGSTRATTQPQNVLRVLLEPGAAAGSNSAVRTHVACASCASVLSASLTGNLSVRSPAALAFSCRALY